MSTQGGSGNPAGQAKDVFPTATASLANRYRRGRPLTAIEVEGELMRLCDLLETTTEELAYRAQAAAEAEANHKGRWASEFLSAEGTEQKRKAEADVVVHALFMQRKVTEGMYAATKEACGSLRAQLDALRTISANIRSQT